MKNASFVALHIRQRLLVLWRTLLAALPSRSQLIRVMPFVVIALVVGMEVASAADIDSLGGSKPGSVMCSFGKSVGNSLIAKGICVAVAGWGLIKWLPSRKDGVNEMIGGVVGFIIASKFVTILGLFGVSC